MKIEIIAFIIVLITSYVVFNSMFVELSQEVEQNQIKTNIMNDKLLILNQNIINIEHDIDFIRKNLVQYEKKQIFTQYYQPDNYAAQYENYIDKNMINMIINNLKFA